jgi:predicted naringenin-chalcone synthase
MDRRVFINRIATAVPQFDVHPKFVDYAPRLLANPRDRKLFARMADRAGIARRYSVIAPHPDPDRLDRDELFAAGAFPGTAARMALYERHAPGLAAAGLAGLALGPDETPTHIVVTSCTGFYAPGLDLDLQRRLGLDGNVERTVIGFMGCNAAINGLKTARHIVRSDPGAKVLLVSVELCTIHVQETDDLDSILSFLLFGDGCAAALISAAPVGLEIRGFHAAVVPDSTEHITWRTGDRGFSMYLSGAVPSTIARGLPDALAALLRQFPGDPCLWAVHPGGRSVLDAVERAAGLDPAALTISREILHAFGNMSSPTVLFVLRRMLAEGHAPGTPGVAMAFGPGLAAEMMAFRIAERADG